MSLTYTIYGENVFTTPLHTSEQSNSAIFDTWCTKTYYFIKLNYKLQNLINRYYIQNIEKNNLVFFEVIIYTIYIIVELYFRGFNIFLLIDKIK